MTDSSALRLRTLKNILFDKCKLGCSLMLFFARQASCGFEKRRSVWMS